MLIAGFLLGGIGELNKNRQPNFLVVDKNTSVSDIEVRSPKYCLYAQCTQSGSGYPCFLDPIQEKIFKKVVSGSRKY